MESIMMKKLYRIGLVVPCVVVSVMLSGIQPAAADGFRNPPESASALGRSGGKYVHVDDASAVTINPANMADIEKPSTMASLTLGYARKEFESAMGGSPDKTEDRAAYLPNAFGILPAGDTYTIGVGVTTPFGRHSKWKDNASFATASPYFSKLSVINVNPGIARKIGKHVSVGAGVSLYQSTLSFDQMFPWSALTGDPTTPSGKASFDGDGYAFGGNFGITWKIADHHAVAFTYRSPFDLEYDGDFEAENMPAAAGAMGFTSRSDFETEIKFPTVIAAGYGVEVTDRLRVEFDVEWIEASRNKQLVVDIRNNNDLINNPGGDPGIPPGSKTVIPQNWDDNWTFGLGLDWQCTETLVARAGYIYLESPSPTSTMIPVASEEDQNVISVGLGYGSGGHAFDIAYAIGILDGVTVSDNANPTVNGKYEHESHLLSLAYGYAF